MPLSPSILQLAAALLCGTATALLGLAAWKLLQTTRRADVRRYTGTSMRRAEMRRRALENHAPLVVVYPWLHMLARGVENLDLESLRQYVRGPYARAGYPGGLDDDEVVAAGFLLGIALSVLLGFSALVLLGPVWVWTGLLGLPMGFLGVVSHLKTKAKQREMKILQALPYVLDLLVLILRSGASLGIALGRVVDDYREHPIGDELEQALAEIDVGASRSEAMKRLASRLDIPDITALADSIVQSEELGWPLATTLERLSDRLTSERILRAQSTAGAAGVLVMLPSTLVLAAAVLLLFGPFIVRLMIYLEILT